MDFFPSNAQSLMHEFLRLNDDAMLSCGMGLSKTGAVLWDIAEKLRSRQIRGALVLGPRRVVNVTWPEEISKWDQFRWMKYAHLTTDLGQWDFLRGRAHIYLVNYESSHILARLLEGLYTLGIKIPFDLVVYDEITKLKNHSSKRAKTVVGSIGRLKYQRGLTGSLQPQSLEDLFAQYRLLDNGKRLGTFITHFRNKFFDSFRTDYGYCTYIPKPGAQEAVAELVADMTLTLKSKDWLDIPEPFFEDIDLELPADIHKKYRKLENDLVYMLTEEEGISVPTMGALVSKLQQFTSGFIYEKKIEEGKKPWNVTHPIHDIKLHALLKAVKASDGPVLIGVGFREEIEMLRKHLPKAKFVEDYKTLSAETELFRAWNRGEIAQLVANPASISHGLNLQYSAHEVLWMTQPYDYDKFTQFNARLARTGQKKNVRIRRFIFEGTVDEAVTGALEDKWENEDALLETMKRLETHNPAKYL